MNKLGRKFMQIIICLRSYSLAFMYFIPILVYILCSWSISLLACLNRLLLIAYSGLTAFLAFNACRRYSLRGSFGISFTLLFLGLAFLSMREILGIPLCFSLYADNSGNIQMYANITNIIKFDGTVLLVAALLIYLRIIGKAIDKTVLTFSTTLTAVTAYLLYAIFSSASHHFIGAGSLILGYALLDILLIALSTLILGAFLAGKLALPWLFISIGFIGMAFFDVTFFSFISISMLRISLEVSPINLLSQYSYVAIGWGLWLHRREL